MLSSIGVFVALLLFSSGTADFRSDHDNRSVTTTTLRLNVSIGPEQRFVFVKVSCGYGLFRWDTDTHTGLYLLLYL